MKNSEIAALLGQVQSIDRSHERQRTHDMLHRNDLAAIDLTKLEGAKAIYYQYDPKARETNKFPAVVRTAEWDLITEGTEDDPNVRRVSKIILHAMVSFRADKQACISGYVRNGLPGPCYFELVGDDEKPEKGTK